MKALDYYSCQQIKGADYYSCQQIKEQIITAVNR